LLKQRSGTNITHVPYKGAAPAYTDLMGGAVDLVVDSLPASISFVQAKQMRVLAVSTAKRDAAVPDVPTVQESGVAGFDVLGWLAIVGPAGMNIAIRDKINAGLKKVLSIDSVRQNLTKLGMQIVANSPDEFARYIASEYARWGEVVKAAGIKAE
jgi:tripartite-type tricarboxylate transporter receptor subunit TctC